MPAHTDISAIPEHDSHSDSDWLDIASTDRDSDDNDSVCSSRETDHEDPSRSRSRRSSLSYGSSRDGDVDAWEGLIDDSADESLPNDVLAPIPHVSSLSHHPATIDSIPAQEASAEELRVNEGLDQSMISTLSSSRSSSLHASTVHTSSRDLRLSFPDPITSSCRELLSTSCEEIKRNSDNLSSPTDVDAPSDVRQADEEGMLSASQTLPSQLQVIVPPVLSGPELKVFLYGLSTSFRWSIVDRLLQKVAHGAGLTITADLNNLQGPTRQLIVSGSFEHDRAFPRIITVFDRTFQPHDTFDDVQPALMNFTCVRPLAVIFMPCRPPYLPENVLRLPVLAPSSYFSGLPDLGVVGASSPQEILNTLDIRDHQLLRITAPEDLPVVDKDSIETIDPTRAYRAFSRLWTSHNDTSKGSMASTHALTIIAILSLILGILVRAAIPISLQQFSPPTLATFNPNSAPGLLWQMIRPAPYRERLPPSTMPGSSVVTIPSSLKEFSLSVFSAESAAITVSHADPTNFRRAIPSTLSERSKFSKDLMLQPPHSVLAPDNRPKALSVIPEPSITAYQPSPVAAGHAVSALVHSAIPSVIKEYATDAVSVVNQDMQDILDALDALVQAISRQTQIILTQATTLIEQSAKHLEKSVESLDVIKETLYVHNERARKRAKEIKEMGTKWLYDASEAVAVSAQLSKGMALEMAEGLAHRAQRARGKAKEVAAEIQGFLNEHERVETLGVSAWYAYRQHWDEWVKGIRMQGKGKPCKRKVCDFLMM